MSAPSFDDMGLNSSKKNEHAVTVKYNPDPSPIYVPFESLTKSVVRSIINVVVPFQPPSWDHSQRTLLIFLLAIKKELEEIENRTAATEEKPHIVEHAAKVRRWLVDRQKRNLDWAQLQAKYDAIAQERCNELAHYYGAKDTSPYFELTMPTHHDVVKQSREYMNRFRGEGFQPEELKVYWNVTQLENLCPKDGDDQDTTPPHDPSDADAVKNLRAYPVATRKHHCEIKYVHKGIEKAVFDIPDDAQIIVLNFANEQSPGGGYLRHAMAQEEVILYNSDGYRALLDLKYGRMGGGYAIPEFGLAYVRNMRFFDPKDNQRHRATDMLVSACYCMNGAELYDNPQSDEEWEKNNLAKFCAFMAAAVANTVGDGKNTYLLLGPIGTGAFGNSVKEIGKVFQKALNMQMMGSTGPVRDVFGHIWFVSIDKWKNNEFRKYIPDDDGGNSADS